MHVSLKEQQRLFEKGQQDEVEKPNAGSNNQWFYLFGHIIVLCHFAALALDDEGILSLLFIIVYLAFVVASVWLQSRLFLVFGALGSYGYLCYLAFEIFDGALGFVFALAFVGLIVVLSAVGYQKYARPWLEDRFNLTPS